MGSNSETPESRLFLIVQGIVLFVIRLTVASICVFPITYFVRGPAGPGLAIVGIFFGALTWVWLLRDIHLRIWKTIVLFGVVDTVFGLSYGLMIPGYQLPDVSSRVAVEYLLIGSILGGIALGWVIQVIDPTGDELGPRRGQSPVRMIAMTLFWGMAIPMLPVISSLNDLSSFKRGAILLSAIVLLYGFSKIGTELGKSTRILAGSGAQVASELRTLGAAGAFFLVSYFILAVFYATVFAAIWRNNNYAFSGDGFPNNPTLLDFLYFSISTIATLGYGDILPKSKLARAFAMSEVLVGVAWVTLILAATVARISRQNSLSHIIASEATRDKAND